MQSFVQIEVLEKSKAVAGFASHAIDLSFLSEK